MSTKTMNTVETPWYVLRSPEIGKKFQDFYKACNEDGVLDKKTKELLMLALASVFRCPHCTEAHIKAALEMGVSKEEITEAQKPVVKLQNKFSTRLILYDGFPIIPSEARAILI